MKRALIVTFVVVAAVVAWWWWHRAHRPAGPVPGVPTRPAGLPAPAAARSGDPQGDLPVLADDDPRGSLRLEGLVLGPDDQPAGGAIVELSANPPRQATTEEDGSFAFDGLLARTYRLVAHAPAGVAGPVTARLGAKTDPVVLHLRAGAALAVTVLGPDGHPMDGATVELRGTEQARAPTRAGKATFAPVVAGFYEVVASAPGLAPAARRIRVAGQVALQLQLAPGAPVSGHVVDEHGAPVAGARVVYVASSELLRRPDPRRDAALTGADGAWRFAALPAGSFRFTATDAAHAPGTSTLVTLDGAHAKAGVVVTMPAGATVQGRVVDAAKQPVAGARVELRLAFRRGRGGPGGRGGVGGFARFRIAPRQAYTDGHGAFVVRGLPRDHLEAIALAEQGASSGVDVDTTAGDVDGVVIPLDLTQTIAGVVVDPDGQPIEGAQVTARPARFGRGAFRRGGDAELTDAGGRFRIGGLAAGAYVVTASRSDAPRGPRFGRGRRGGGDGVEAQAGDQDVKIVLPPEGGVKGKVAFTDGTAPAAYTVSAGGVEQAFVTPDFAIDALAPGQTRLEVTGPSFDDKVVDVTIESAKTADLGTLTVARGRRIAGTVVANGQPVAGATVYAGRQVLGGGTSNDAPMAGMAALSQGTKTAITEADGTFALAGFGDGDLAVIAELPSLGRSTPRLVGAADPGQTELVLELQPYGALAGTLRQAGQPAPGIVVTVQSTTTPGAVYIVTTGADGRYRFDKLAPDTYKVSATVGNPRRGLHFYSRQADVPPGKEVDVDLEVDAGAVTLDATAVAAQGEVGMAVAYLASGALAAATSAELSRALAAAGPGASQVVVARPGAPAEFAEVTPGAYTACFVPLPLEVRGFAALGYLDRHAGTLAAFCKAVAVAPQPDTQALSIPVVVPPLAPDEPGGGTAGGPGRTGGGAPPPTRAP